MPDPRGKWVRLTIRLPAEHYNVLSDLSLLVPGSSPNAVIRDIVANNLDELRRTAAMLRAVREGRSDDAFSALREWTEDQQAQATSVLEHIGRYEQGELERDAG